MLHSALEVRGVDGSLVLAAADDYSPTAAEDVPSGIRIFFASATERDLAGEALRRAWPEAVLTPLDVDDEDWARRSQENLAPITVGRLTIVPGSPALPGLLSSTGAGAPPPTDPRLLRGAGDRLQASADQHLLKSEAGSLQPAVSSARHGRRRSPPAPPALPALSLVIPPSTGFGTGHHWTTRFCLLALQEIDLAGKTVLDVGTGSGILAIAARLLGAREAVGIDNDEDALHAARESLERNAGVNGVTFERLDLSGADSALPTADVVAANLTGVLLRRSADALAQALRPRGSLIVSGLLATERDQVVAAFRALEPVSEAIEQEWAGLVFRRRPR